MPRVEVIGNGQAPNVDNSVVLRVPLGASLEETVAATRSQIAKAYALSDSAGTTPPKYRLYDIRQEPAVKLNLVHHAVITSISKWSYQPSPGTGDLVNQVSIEFMQRHLDDMGWRLGAKEREDLMERDYIPVHMQDTYRVLIGRHRKLFRALSRNTIRASFPDKRPFNSLVWDRFQMKQTYK